jgi:tetratricopeptide (TPR) repeat protein
MFRSPLQLRTKGALRLGVFVLLFAGVTSAAEKGSPPAGKDQGEAARLFAEAAQDVNGGQYAAAIEKYNAILLLQPNSPEALSNLGVAYHLAERFGEAVETLQKALRLNPDLIPANLILGMDYVRLGRPQEALEPLRQVLKREPRNRDALLALASAYFAAGDFTTAASVYQSEVGYRADDADAWYGMGLCYEHSAEATTRKLHDVGVDSAYYYRLVGQFLTEEGAEIDAEEAFRRALVLAGSDNEGLHAALGFAHLRLGLLDEADQDFSQEARLHPGNLEGLLGGAAVALARADYPAALAALCKVRQADENFLFNRLPFLVASLDAQAQSKAKSYLRDHEPAVCPASSGPLAKEIVSPGAMVSLHYAFDTTLQIAKTQSPAGGARSRGPDTADNPRLASACSAWAQRFPTLNLQEAQSLAQCSCSSGRYLVCLRAAESAAHREPQNVASLFWQAEAARHLAQAAFQQAVELKPDSWQGNILLGDIYRQRKNWSEAIQHYQSAASLNTSVPAPFLGLATVHWQTGEFDQAEIELRKALALDPGNSQANFELGDIFVRRHRFQEAIPYLRRTIHQGPDLLIAHGDLGKALAGVGETEEAITELTRAKPVDRFGDIHYQLYLLYRGQGQKEKAEQALATSEQLRKLELRHQSTRLARAAEAAKAGTQVGSQDLPPHP